MLLTLDGQGHFYTVSKKGLILHQYERSDKNQHFSFSGNLWSENPKRYIFEFCYFFQQLFHCVTQTELVLVNEW